MLLEGTYRRLCHHWLALLEKGLQLEAFDITFSSKGVYREIYLRSHKDHPPPHLVCHLHKEMFRRMQVSILDRKEPINIISVHLH